MGYDEVPLSFRINKPTVLSTGEWIMPVTHAAEPIHDWFAGPKQLQGVGISTDQGKTWRLHGAIKAPHWALENMIVQLKDGRLWMLIRTGSGLLWQSYSSDRGKTWTEAIASTIANPGSRFFIRRLASGNLSAGEPLPLQGAQPHHRPTLRRRRQDVERGPAARRSRWRSYPDGVQAEDGLVWIVYDRDRQGAGEILLATFREEDVSAGQERIRRGARSNRSSTDWTSQAPPPPRRSCRQAGTRNGPPTRSWLDWSRSPRHRSKGARTIPTSLS